MMIINKWRNKNEKWKKKIEENYQNRSSEEQLSIEMTNMLKSKMRSSNSVRRVHTSGRFTHWDIF